MRPGDARLGPPQADGTLVLPGAFIPLMESSGLIYTLTRNLIAKGS
jgi:sensor c-di-GMP phosphodiesterase-like protein